MKSGTVSWLNRANPENISEGDSEDPSKMQKAANVTRVIRTDEAWVKKAAT